MQSPFMVSICPSKPVNLFKWPCWTVFPSFRFSIHQKLLVFSFLSWWIKIFVGGKMHQVFWASCISTTYPCQKQHYQTSNCVSNRYVWLCPHWWLNLINIWAKPIVNQIRERDYQWKIIGRRLRSYGLSEFFCSQA